MHELEQIDLGEHGKDFYRSIADMVVKVKPKYQVYAAAVIFGVPQAYVHAVSKDKVLPGKFVKDGPGTRRYTEGTTNFK